MVTWMIEQYEHAKHGADYHTWYGGRFIDKWADPDIKDRLCKTFAHYDATDMAVSLVETMDLYRSLALEVAEAYGFEYPSHADTYASGWVNAKISRITAE
jgi:aminoglycoside 6-adenylyltransferase